MIFCQPAACSGRSPIFSLNWVLRISMAPTTTFFEKHIFSSSFFKECNNGCNLRMAAGSTVVFLSSSDSGYRNHDLPPSSTKPLRCPARSSLVPEKRTLAMSAVRRCWRQNGYT